MEKIFLIGFMAAGKSTIGRELANILGWNFFDVDAVIEKKFGKPIKEIFSIYGEPFFRTEEREVLQSIIDQKKVVVATGGGMPIYFDNLKVMKNNGYVVYLAVPFNVILDRLNRNGESESRPLAKNKDLEKLFAFRESYYKKAHFVCDTNNLTPDQIANKIKGAFKRWNKLI